MKKSIWAEKTSFFKIALKRVLVLPRAISLKMRQFPLKNMGLQNIKQKHIRGDKTLKIDNFAPNINIDVYAKFYCGGGGVSGGVLAISGLFSYYIKERGIYIYNIYGPIRKSPGPKSIPIGPAWSLY